MIPKPVGNLTIESKGSGISKIHEILFNATNDFKVQWKMLSSELEYTDAVIFRTAQHFRTVSLAISYFQLYQKLSYIH